MGAAAPSFSAANVASPNANFSVAGTYVLRLTVSDSMLSASDDVQVVANAFEEPLSAEEIVNKFRANARLALPEGHIEMILDSVMRLEHLPSVGPLADLLSPS